MRTSTQVGLSATERLFVKRQWVARNIAVMFLIDMSGSTKGWINDIERESLVLDHLPHMYGSTRFTVISDVHKLPYRVADIYRRLTI